MTFNNKYCYNIRVICKVVERGHENHQFGRTGDDTRNWSCKKYKGVEWGAKLEFRPKLRVK
jgi:hypothetical protein